MRFGLMFISLALAGCESKEDAGSSPEGEALSSAELDKNELTEELVAALITENQPPPACTPFNIAQWYSAVVPGGTETERWYAGKDQLPRDFVLTSNQLEDPYTLQPLINAGLLTAAKVGERTSDTVGPFNTANQTTWQVYRIDFSDDVKNSMTFIPNMGNNVSSAPGVIIMHCRGPATIRNIQYSLPNESSRSSATFTWDSSREEPLAERFRSMQGNGEINLPALQPMNGTGSASFQLTNNGWVVSNVQFN